MMIVKVPPDGADSTLFGLDPKIMAQVGLHPMFAIDRGKTIGCFHVQFQSKFAVQIHTDFLPDVLGKKMKKAYFKLEGILSKEGITEIITIFPEFPRKIRGFVWMVGGRITSEIPNFYEYEGKRCKAILAIKSIGVV